MSKRREIEQEFCVSYHFAANKASRFDPRETELSPCVGEGIQREDKYIPPKGMCGLPEKLTYTGQRSNTVNKSGKAERKVCKKAGEVNKREVSK
ncbi:hypothetical protein MRB53_005290 [Persea americana]|uniref:Uncharacterized protein n=1 Tax=Persea americana TaxID=3435 RepID=A0ACC2MCM4_PERAE|nr:hypothetical protein MRB53_005290 [Persea americana]